jgi:hypothetical protein
MATGSTGRYSQRWRSPGRRGQVRWLAHTSESVACPTLRARSGRVTDSLILDTHSTACGRQVATGLRSGDRVTGRWQSSSSSARTRRDQTGRKIALVLASRLPNNGDALLDGDYRYRLWRRWDPNQPIMGWVMLNPSTADDQRDDQTLRKCMGFARTHDHGA